MQPDPFAPLNRALRDLDEFLAAPDNPFRLVGKANRNAEETLQEIQEILDPLEALQQAIRNVEQVFRPK